MNLNLRKFLVIYLELFCLRFCRKYQPEVIRTGYLYVKEFILGELSKYNDYSEFRRRLNLDSTSLHTAYFNFVQDFLRYIKRFGDK